MLSRATIRWLIVLGIWLLSISPIAESFARSADPASPIIETFTDRDYGAEAQIWSIAQNQSGLLYFSVYKNIAQYDGSRWRLIPVPTGPVRSLATGLDGTVYVGLVNDFGMLTPDATGRMSYVSLADKRSDDAELLGNIEAICPTSHGVYFVTLKKTLRWHAATLTTVDFGAKRGQVVQDRAWLMGPQQRLAFVDGGQLKKIPYFDRRQQSTHVGGAAILSWTDGRVLYADGSWGLFLIDLDDFLKLDALGMANTDQGFATVVTQLQSDAFDYLPNTESTAPPESTGIEWLWGPFWAASRSSTIGASWSGSSTPTAV